MKKYAYLVISFAFFLLFLSSCIPYDMNHPPIVILVKPVNGATNMSTKVVLEWEASDKDNDELSFDVYLSDNKAYVIENDENVIVYRGQGTSTVVDLRPFTDYYWKVIVSDGSTEVESDVRSFSTGGNVALKMKIPDHVGTWEDEVDVKLNLIMDGATIDTSNLIYSLYIDGTLYSTGTSPQFKVPLGSDRTKLIGDHEYKAFVKYRGITIAYDKRTLEIYPPIVASNFIDGQALELGSEVTYKFSAYDIEHNSLYGEITPKLSYDKEFLNVVWNENGFWESTITESTPGSHEIDLVFYDKDGENIKVGNISQNLYFYKMLNKGSASPILNVYVVEYNLGPGVENASVYLYKKESESVDFVASKTTDKNGLVSFTLDSTGEYDIKIGKDGYAPSAVYGLELKNEIRNYKILLRKASIDSKKLSDKGYFEDLPQATVAFYTDSSKSEKFDMSGNWIKADKLYVGVNDIYTKVEATGRHLINIIYAAVNKIPGASFATGQRLYAPATNTAEGYVDLSGASGKTEIHIVVYDSNDARADYVFYADVVRTNIPYIPYKIALFSDFGYTNIDAYTRRRALEFYGIPISPKKSRGFKDGIPESAPKNSNMWIEVWFVDYDAALQNGIISSSVTRPEGYSVYRSEDGINWEKVGFVADTDNQDTVFIDSDPRIVFGKVYHYLVKVVYRGKESFGRYLGYVVPMSSFNVELLNPENDSTNVDRDPKFIWKPTNDVFSIIPSNVTYDGTYTYTLWIYDLVQSENHLFPLTKDKSSQLILSSKEATEMSLKFSSVPWGIVPMDFGKIYLYPYDKLEANKTYEWTVDLAFAYTEYKEGNSSAYSIAIDEGYGVDPFKILEGDMHNTFTTGN